MYPHKVKVVGEEEIMEAIERQDPDVVFLHKVGPEGATSKPVVTKSSLVPPIHSSITSTTIPSANQRQTGFC